MHTWKFDGLGDIVKKKTINSKKITNFSSVDWSAIRAFFSRRIYIQKTPQARYGERRGALGNVRGFVWTI